jgi:hypothetical protein
MIYDEHPALQEEIHNAAPSLVAKIKDIKSGARELVPAHGASLSLMRRLSRASIAF